MTFWDSSAIVPLLFEEPASPACRALLRSAPRQVVWFFTRTEVQSALWRKLREGQLKSSVARTVEARLDSCPGH